MHPALQIALVIPAALAILAVAVIFAIMQSPVLGLEVINEMDKKMKTPPLRRK